MGKPPLTLVTQPQDYFRELVLEAMGKQKISAQPETEFYLVNLLNQFITTDRLYSPDENGGVREQPLAFLIKDALEQPTLQAKRASFRRIGDVSLYVAGYFQDSLTRKLVDVDYYIDIGGKAYHHVASSADEAVMKVLYGELSEKFSAFVDVLAEVSDKTASRTEKDLLRMYELWVRTRSERAAKALQEAGILPNETIKKDWQ